MRLTNRNLSDNSNDNSTIITIYCKIMLPSKSKDILGDFDLSRTDKFYVLKIPTYSIENGVVLYEMVLKDLITGETYSCKYRFKELKAVQ
jgi:hypothetical protein